MGKNSRLREARIKAGLSQQELAEKIGSSSSYVTMIENGKGFSIKKARQLGELLGVDAEWLYYGNKEEEGEEDQTPKKNGHSPTVHQNEEKEMLPNQVISTYQKYIDRLERENETLGKENADLKRQVDDLLNVKAKRSAS